MFIVLFAIFLCYVIYLNSREASEIIETLFSLENFKYNIVINRDIFLIVRVSFFFFLYFLYNRIDIYR